MIPNRRDRVNWTDQQRRDRPHGGQGRPSCASHCRKRSTSRSTCTGAMTSSTGQARGQGARTVPAAVARRAGAGRKRGCDARGPAVYHDADLLRRESVPAARLPRSAREAGGRHHHAGHAEVRRPARNAKDRRHGAHLLRAGGAALRGVTDRQHGCLPRLRGDTEFPRAGVALDPAAEPVERASSRRARSSRRGSSPSPTARASASR